ncbi:hypothetical protein TNCV_2931571 [Trichonephila clavipes]|nr:hypothetical protein TNCV_2931571 [Trichonephila clavipes]
MLSSENSAFDNPEVRMTRPHPCRSKNSTCKPFEGPVAQDIMPDADIITAVTANEKIPENDDVNAENTPEISQSK